MRPVGGPGRPLVVVAGLAVVLIVFTACTGSQGIPGASHSQSPSPSLSSPTAQAGTYQVVASVLHTKGMERPIACYAVLTSLPPAGCSGVLVAGYDLEHIKGVHRAGRAWWTPVLRLVGTWDGHVLTLTRPPVIRRHSSGTDTSAPATCVATASSFIKGLARRVTGVHAKINMMALEPCGQRIWILVAAADQYTKRYLRQHFGNHFLIKGWLQPLSR
jgi:hypothetical protein